MINFNIVKPDEYNFVIKLCCSALYHGKRKGMKVLKSLLIPLITLLSFSVCHSVRAADENIAIVNVKVTVTVPPSCIINNNNVIEVNFGDSISVTDIDGKKNLQRLNYSLECKGITKNSLRLLMEGTAAEFDSTLLATTQENLGIAFYNNGEPFPLNTWKSFIYPNILTIDAAPLKKENASLKLGNFSATALIRIDYD